MRWTHPDPARAVDSRLALKDGSRVAVLGGGPAGSFFSIILLAVSSGVNSKVLQMFEHLDIGYQPPRTTRALIREFYLGAEAIAQTLGNVMHVFLMDIPRLEFAALIPKGDYVTRLYKDGIGAAYRTAKAAVSTVLLHGISSEALRCHYLPACRAISRDNRVGRFTRSHDRFSGGAMPGARDCAWFPGSSRPLLHPDT